MSKHHKFWMVWSPQGRAPTHKHWTKEEAEREARRLACISPGREFYVLKAVGGFQSSEPVVEEIDVRGVNPDALMLF